MFRYRKQLTLGLVLLLILSLAASLFSGVINSATDQSTLQPCDQSNSQRAVTLIQNQVFAFGSGNPLAAYGYFSEDFKSEFDQERFLQAVESDYPMLLEGGALSFGECNLVEIGLAQELTLTNASSSHRLLFVLGVQGSVLAVEGITVVQ